MRVSMPTPFLRLVVLGLLCICPSLVMAQNTTLEIKCVDQSGAPLSGVQVFVQRLKPQDGKKPEIKNHKTNRQGVAEFKKLKNGFYRVLGRVKGFDPALYEYAELTGQPQASVALTFHPGKQEKLVYFEDAGQWRHSYELLRQGVVSLQAKKFAEAEQTLKSSLGINPSNPDTYRNLAIAFIQQAKWEPAEETLKQAESFYRAEMTTLAEDAENRKLYQQSLAQTRVLLDKLPVFKLAAEGDAALRAKKFDVAIDKYNQLVTLEPKEADHYYNLAVALANAQRFDEATEMVDEALGLKPGDKSFEDLKKRVVKNKEAAKVDRVKKILAEGDDLYNQGNYAGALRKYEQARGIIPEEYLHVLVGQLAKAHAKLGHQEEASKAFHRAIELAPDEEKNKHRQELARYYLEHNHYQDGIRVYEDLYRHQSPDAVDQKLFALAKQFIEKEKSDLVELTLERVIELNPQHAEAYYELGMHYFYDKNNKTRAKELLTSYVGQGKMEDHLENAKAVLAVIKAGSR